MLLQDSPAVFSLGVVCEELSNSYEWKRQESPSLNEDGKVIWYKSENHVPIGAVPTKGPRTPDNPSCDRLQIPGASTPGDQPRKVLQPDVPHQQNPGQASGDRLHFPGVEAPPGDRSHKVPDWRQPVKEGLSGEPSDSHNVVMEQPVVEPREKHLMT